MYDIGPIGRFREIILAEPDEEKQQDLLDLLRAIVRENDEEIDLWLEFLEKKYALAFKGTLILRQGSA
jgi:hypothetical protein